MRKRQIKISWNIPSRRAYQTFVYFFRGNWEPLRNFQFHILDISQNILQNAFFEIFQNTFWDILKKH